MIRRRDEDAPSTVGIQHLEDGVHDAAQLTVLRRIFALLAQGVELVEQRDHGMRGNEVEHFAQVRRGFPKKGRNHAVRAHDRQRPTEFERNDLGGQRLAAARRTAQKHPVARAKTVRQQDLLPVLLPEKLLDERAVGGRQHDVLELPRRFAYRKQWKTTLAVLGNIAGQLAHRRGGWRPRASVENGLEIVREQMVLFLPLLGDHRLRRSAESLDVAFRAGPNELSQQLAVGHGSFTTSRRPVTRVLSAGLVPVRPVTGL